MATKKRSSLSERKGGNLPLGRTNFSGNLELTNDGMSIINRLMSVTDGDANPAVLFGSDSRSFKPRAFPLLLILTGDKSQKQFDV